MINAELVQMARRICRITWNDQETDERVISIAENAAAHLHDLFGIPGEVSPEVFLKPGTIKMLYENYCLYCWNNMPEEFEPNYRSDILKVQRKYKVEAAKSEDNQNKTETGDV